MTPPPRASQRPLIFYDGDCGLCHWLVRFTLPRDRRGVFRYSPLQGETVRALLSDAERAALPDSVVARTRRGRLLTRSDAVIYVLRGLGGGWKGLGAALRLIPRPLRDLAYRGVARVRKYLFKRPKGHCPIVPPQWRHRILP